MPHLQQRQEQKQQRHNSHHPLQRPSILTPTLVPKKSVPYLVSAPVPSPAVAAVEFLVSAVEKLLSAAVGISSSCAETPLLSSSGYISPSVASEIVRERMASLSHLHLPVSLDPSRESTLQLVHRLLRGKDRILDSYHKVKSALKEMQDKYGASKDNINLIQRYYNMKRMVKEVIVLEEHYWQVLELPKQEVSESQADYVFRIMGILDKRIETERNVAPPPSTGLKGMIGHTAKLAEKAREVNLIEKLKAKSTDELRKTSLSLQTDICRLSKKYIGLRNLVVQLRNNYRATRGYPIIPRYQLLKDMIKEVLRARSFVEVCHEIEE